MKPKRPDPLLAGSCTGCFAFSVVLSIAGLSTPSANADATWMGGSAGGPQDWNTLTNWFPANPGGVLTVPVTTGGNFPILGAPSAFAAGDIQLGLNPGNSGRLDIQNAGSINIGGSWMYVGREGGTGVFNVESGGTFNAGSVRVAAGVGATTGTMTVGGTVTTTGDFRVSEGTNNVAAATGNVTVTNGGVIHVGGDLMGAFAGANTTVGTLTIHAGGTVNMPAAVEKWVIVNKYDAARGRIIVNGTLNLGNLTDIRFSTGGNGVGASVVTLNSGGAITGGTGSVLDLNQSTNAAVNNTFNLDGGTLTIAQILTSNNNTAGNGTSTFNFNGGTLKATTDTEIFVHLDGPTQRAVVKSGGAIIDSNGKDITIQRPLFAGAPSGGLTKLGAGTLSLWAANTYTGVTNVEAGTLHLESIASLASDVVVKNGATLTGAGTVTKTVTFNAGSTFSPMSEYGLVMDGVTFSGATNLSFKGTPVNGFPNTLLRYGAGGVTGLSNLTSSGFRVVIVNDPANSRILGTVTTADLTWNQNSGIWVSGGAGWTGAFPTYFDGDGVTFNERPSASTVTLSGVLLPSDVIVNNTSNPYIFGGSGSIGGATGLYKQGAGALTLATANSHGGGTVLAAGTLNLNHADALGHGFVSIEDGVIDNTSAGAIVMTANNLQHWNRNLTFTGTRNLDMGTGEVTIGQMFSTQPVTVTVTGGTLAVGKLVPFLGDLSSLVKSGAGKLEIGSTGMYPAGGSSIHSLLAVNAGTLQINRTGAVAAASGDFSCLGLTGRGTVTNGASVERWLFSAPESGSVFSFSGFLADGGTGPLGFFMGGGGTQILSGANTYSGPTTVAGGVLRITQPVLADNAGVFIQGSGILELTHKTIDQVGSLVIAGVVQPDGIYDSTNSPIIGNGKLRVGPPAYPIWAAVHAAGQASNLDFDHDGVQNGVEYFMGATGATFTANPGIVSGKVRWPKDPGFSGTYTVQISPDLLNWTPVTSTVVDNAVEYTVPIGQARLYIRLNVVPN